jgi:hypothetical protein
MSTFPAIQGTKARAKDRGSVSRFKIGEDGKQTVTFEDDHSLPYVRRHPKGLLPEHAPIRRFSRRKPRYVRDGNLLVILPARKRRG